MQQVSFAAAPYITEGQLSCADAHSLAASLDLTPGQFAQAIAQNTDIRFYRCQLGLFGYGPKSAGLSKIVLPAKHVPAEIQAKVDAVTHDGGISCVDVWAIADRHAYPRLGLSNIVEAMGLRIRPCQLGCF